MINRQLMIVLVIIAMLMIPLRTSAQVFGPISYVAIGDSLAAGQTPSREIDTGYSDLIAQEIARNQSLVFYTKDLAFPGFTTANVLERIQSKEAKLTLQRANIITISAGANDLLRLIQVNANSGSLAFQQIPVDYSLNAVRKNMMKILAELKAIAPNAQVYVMGYYFAYPFARDSQKKGTAIQLNKLNDILKNVALDAGVNFVSVNEAFGDDATDKVPNPSDVHPNGEGYRAMANSFLNVYASGSMQVSQNEMPPANPLTFEQIRQAQKGTADVKNESALLPSAYLKDEYMAITELKPLI